MRSFFAGLFKKKAQSLPVVKISRQTMARFCCHAVSSPEGRVEAFGEYTDTTMPRNEQGGYDFCHTCLGKMAIRCGWCTHAIFVGDPVTLYMPSDPYHWFPSGTAFMSFDRQAIVGCMRCADTGADCGGFWIPSCTRRDGKWIGGVKRIPSLYETALANGGIAVAEGISSAADMPTLPGVQVPERVLAAL